MHDQLFMMQISLIKSSCKFALKGLKSWMKPEKVMVKNILWFERKKH